MSSENLRLILDGLGALGTICTVLGLLLPKGSAAGYWFGKLGADLKGHTQPSDAFWMKQASQNNPPTGDS